MNLLKFLLRPKENYSFPNSEVVRGQWNFTSSEMVYYWPGKDYHKTLGLFPLSVSVQLEKSAENCGVIVRYSKRDNDLFCAKEIAFRHGGVWLTVDSFYLFPGIPAYFDRNDILQFRQDVRCSPKERPDFPVSSEVLCDIIEVYSREI